MARAGGELRGSDLHPSKKDEHHDQDLHRRSLPRSLFFCPLSPPAAADWRKHHRHLQYRAVLGGENEADRLRRYDCFADLMSETLGVPVELFPASDYAGVMQGLLAGQLHQAGLGASAYAGIYLQDADAVSPVLTTKNVDDKLGLLRRDLHARR